MCVCVRERERERETALGDAPGRTVMALMDVVPSASPVPLPTFHTSIT